jgi:hypothetical protein
VIVTEEEARMKQCPFSFNRQGFWRCVASECMAWREIIRPGAYATIEGNKIEFPEESKGGYCGLAGNPLANEKLILQSAEVIG